jgi:hypothetical protein
VAQQQWAKNDYENPKDPPPQGEWLAVAMSVALGETPPNGVVMPVADPHKAVLGPKPHSG